MSSKKIRIEFDREAIEYDYLSTIKPLDRHDLIREHAHKTLDRYLDNLNNWYEKEGGIEYNTDGKDYKKNPPNFHLNIYPGSPEPSYNVINRYHTFDKEYSKEWKTVGRNRIHAQELLSSVPSSSSSSSSSSSLPIHEEKQADHSSSSSSSSDSLSTPIPSRTLNPLLTNHRPKRRRGASRRRAPSSRSHSSSPTRATKRLFEGTTDEEIMNNPPPSSPDCSK
jgi:hypothetical protein